MRFGTRGGFGGGRPRSSGGFGGGRGGGGGRSSGGFGGGSGSFEKPVKEGEEYDVEISEVGSKGDGIAKIKNFVIFVPGTKKGDKVKIRITQVRAKSAVAELVSGGSGPAPAAAEGESAPATEGSTESEGEESEETMEDEEEM